MKLLHVCADPNPTEDSVAKQLAAKFFSQVIQTREDAEIVNIDLYEDKPPFVSQECYRGIWYPILIQGYSQTEAEINASNYAQRHGEDFNTADVLVLTMPMWNNSVPAAMKAWIDQVITPGITYEFNNGVPLPLHKVKKIILLAASGETFRQDDEKDLLTRQIEVTFGKIGIDDISVAWADGQLSMLYSDSETRKLMAMEAAEELAEDLADLASTAAG
jgi:FMN-dependent NADH-azoreductase